ncbi:MAG TPA: methyltransferase domain-containing protein [Candidatus Methylacidiphilales bacterium]|nr:methyltransferase domain-containing protein [Candidatus Methylacidiphilales bacterium]
MEHNPRDLEWQRRYEEEDTPWDKGAPSPALADYLRENRIEGRILVPGCGRGHDVRALAAQQDADVVGLDLSPAAITEAQRLAAHAPGVFRFITGDFFQLTPDLTANFDWLVEHTCFCAIDPRLRHDYVEAAANALRTGGKVFAIFYMNPDSETAPPFPVTRGELSALFDPHFTLLEEWAPRNSFPGREQRELVRLLQKRPTP